MTLTTTQDKALAAAAQARLDRLAHCRGIVPSYLGDDGLVACSNDHFQIYRIDDGSWRHSQAEIATMRRLVEEGAWPRP